MPIFFLFPDFKSSLLFDSEEINCLKILFFRSMRPFLFLAEIFKVIFTPSSKKSCKFSSEPFWSDLFMQRKYSFPDFLKMSFISKSNALRGPVASTKNRKPSASFKAF